VNLGTPPAAGETVPGPAAARDRMLGFAGAAVLATLGFEMVPLPIRAQIAPLAALIAFLVPRTFIFALRGDYGRHAAWARVTFPIWYYVSVTGVLVYLFLYVWWPASA